MPNTTIHKYTFSRWFKGERCNNPLCMYCCVKLSENLLTNFSQKPKSHLKVTRLQATCIPEWIGRKLHMYCIFFLVCSTKITRILVCTCSIATVCISKSVSNYDFGLQTHIHKVSELLESKPFHLQVWQLCTSYLKSWSWIWF